MNVAELRQAPWFLELMDEVQAEYDRLQGQRLDRRPAMQEEKIKLEAQIQGWTQSLGNPELDYSVREMIEASLKDALQRMRNLETALSEDWANSQRLESIVNPQQVVDRLSRLAEVLAMNNPSLGNIALSQHIDHIDCFPDGKVVMRTCRLGALAGAIEALASDETGEEDQPSGATADVSKQVVPRRRTRRRIATGEAPTTSEKALAIWASDPHRFSGLDKRWFEEHVFEIPRKVSWAEKHAAAVARRRAAGLTTQKLAEEFGKTIPTIREALRHAARLDESVSQLPRKMPRARWAEDRAAEVAALKAQGFSTKELAARFGKSDTTIRAALKHAQRLSASSPGGAEKSDDVDDGSRDPEAA